MKTGLVKWFNTQKGYGFIKPVDRGFDVYVHIKTVQRAGWVELKEGQKICFDSVVDERSVPPHRSPQEGQRLFGGVVARS